MNGKMIIIRYYCLTGALLALFSPGIRSQEPGKALSPAAMEWLKTTNLWRQTSNAAGLLLDDTVRYAELSAAYDTYRGSFRQPEQGERENNLNFSAEGVEKLKNTYVWGRFDYLRQTIGDAQYNASLVDPFRGMPYYVIDENASNWSNQRYDLAFKAAHPVSSKVMLGIEGAYRAWIGAKQRDIRVDSRLYTVDLKPSIVYSVAPGHHIGANLHYYNLKEYSDMSILNLYILQNAYEMYGLGNARRTAGIDNGREGVYIGNNIGAGVQYSYNGPVQVLLTSEWDKKVEDAQVGQTLPRDEGTVKDVQWVTRLQAFHQGLRYSHALTFEYAYRHIDGIEYVTLLNDSTGWEILHSDIRSKYRTRQATAGYTLFANGADGYDWLLGGEIAYTKKKDDYLLPASQMAYENISFALRVKKNILLSSRLSKRLLLGADARYNANLSGHYRYGGNFPEYITVTGLQQSDYEYLSSSFYSAGLSAVYSQCVNDRSGVTAFAKAAFSYSHTNDFNSGNRSHIHFSIGCNF